MSDQVLASLNNLVRRNSTVTPEDQALQRQAKRDLLKVKAIAKLSADLGVGDKESVAAMQAVIDAVDQVQKTAAMLQSRLNKGK